MTSSRQLAARAFADAHGFADVPMHLIAGDASNRKYYRLPGSARPALVMDAPPDKGEDIRPFTKIARWLNVSGFSAPEIIAEDAETGFLLIEDFGDALFARLFEAGEPETPLYAAATDVLVALHKIAAPDVPEYNSDVMAEMAALCVTWYRFGVTGAADEALAGALHARMKALLEPLDADLTCLIQRDYHAENLIWLPDRSGVARVGLLDFQDAMRGHAAYDLVSILQDARRDVPPALAEQMLARYISSADVPADAFRRAYHLLGLQRNLRIVGVFARLCLRDGKPGYLPLIPRVWAHVLHNLDVLQDDELTRFVRETLPDPTPVNLERIAAS